VGRKNDDNFRTMIEVAVKNQKASPHRRELGLADSALLTKMMDENSCCPSQRPPAKSPWKRWS